MAITLNETQHDQLDDLLGALLDLHASGEFGKKDVVAAIAHLVAAAGRDNQTEIIAWIADPTVLQRWKDQPR